MKYNDITYKACLPAFTKASENAKAHGTPYGITITTTPNNLDVAAGAFCKSMMDGAAKWTVSCFDFSDEELDSWVDANSTNLYIYVEYTYKQLGRDDNWLKEQIRMFNGDLAKIKREILLEWPISMDSSVFTEEELERIHHYVKEPVTHIWLLDKKYQIDFYESPDFNTNYILSCDVSGGLSHDYSVINIIHPEDFRIVGDFRNNKIDTDTFKILIKTLMKFYFRNGLLVVERNSYGLPILADLMKDPTVEPRMYRENKETLGEKTMDSGFVVKKKTKRVMYGVETNAITRKQMFDMLPEIVDTEYEKIVSPNLYHELSTLERKRNGRIEANDNSHDDCIMAYLIFRWAVYYGTCFKTKFGISPVASKTNVKVVSSSENLLRIEDIMRNANYTADSNTNYQNSPIYQRLEDQELKMNKTINNNDQLSAFLRITGLGQ